MTKADTTDTSNEDDTSKSEDKTPPLPATLDELHDRVMNERGEELLSPEGEGDEEDATAGEDEDDSDGDDTANKKDKDEEDATAGDKVESGDAEDDTTEEELPKIDPPETMDDDVSKPGKYKAKFTDAEGNVFHVTDVDQLPDDFEPKSFKDNMKSLQTLSKVQDQAVKDQVAFEDAQAAQGRDQQIKQLTESWNKDIKVLTDTKKLPEAEADRKKVIDGVYSLMQEEMNNGRRIDSFEHAFEIYSFRNPLDTADKEAARKEKVAEIKAKGSKVMGGGPAGGKSTSTKSNYGGRTITAPPPGLTLDDIHMKAVGSL